LDKGKIFSERIVKERRKNGKENWEIYGEISFTGASRREKTNLKSRNFSLRHYKRMITRKGRSTFGKIITQWTITS